MKRIADFLFEAGMLKKTPRSGWQFLGSGSESVAEHIFRTAVIAYVLCKLDENANADKAVMLALFHDLPEARTSDLNYMNQKYVTVDENKAIEDQIRGLPFAAELKGIFDEFGDQETLEAVIVKDADNLEMLLQLRELQDVGNQNAKDWIPHTVKRLKTANAKELAEQILVQNSSDWWFDRDSDWWVNRVKK